MREGRIPMVRSSERREPASPATPISTRLIAIDAGTRYIPGGFESEWRG